MSGIILISAKKRDLKHMAKQKQTKIKFLPLILAVAMLTVGFSSLALIGRASAANFTQTMVRLDRLKFSTVTGGLVCTKTPAANTGTEGKVLLTIPTNSATDYVLAGAASWIATGVTVSINGVTSTAWPGLSATAATTVAGKVVTWASGDLTLNSTLYCFTFTATPLTNASNNTETVSGALETQTAAAATLDKGIYSIGLAGAAANDDTIVLSQATVPPSFSFNLGAATDAFTGNLSVGSVISTAGVDATISTNAAGGYIVWAKDLQNSGSKGALFSATANYYIVGTTAVGTGTARVLTAGTADYGLAATVGANPAGGGTLTIDINYRVSATGTPANAVGTLDPTGYRTVATSNGPASLDKVNLKERAAISGFSKAAVDYTDAITIVAAGLF